MKTIFKLSIVTLLLQGCASGPEITSPIIPGLISSTPFEQVLDPSRKIQGKKFSNGLIEAKLETPDYIFTSGQWEGDLAFGNAALGELKIKIPGGVISTKAGLKNFIPFWKDDSGSMTFPGALVMAVGKTSEKSIITFQPMGFREEVTVIDSEGKESVMRPGLGAWMELAQMLNQSSQKRVTKFIGLKAVGYSLSVRVLPNKKTENKSIARRARFGLFPAQKALWRLALTDNEGEREKKESSEYSPLGIVIEKLESGYIVKGQTVDGQIDGPVLVQSENSNVIIKGSFSQGSIQGALKEYAPKLQALILPLQNDWLRVDLANITQNCKLQGLPLEARGEWLVPKDTCGASGYFSGKAQVLIRNDYSYALLNVDAEEGYLNKAALTALQTQGEYYVEGGFSRGIFSGAKWRGAQLVDMKESVPNRLAYQGPFVEGVPEGEGICGYDQNFEPCSYGRGFRNDPVFMAREMALAESKRVQTCELAWMRFPGSGSNFVKSISSNRCDGEWDEIKRMTESALRVGPDFFNPDNTGGLLGAINSTESCYQNYFIKPADQARADFNKNVELMRMNNCYDDSIVSAERRVLDKSVSDVKAIASQGMSNLSSARQIQRQGVSSYNAAVAQRSRQLSADIANSIRQSWNSTYTYLNNVRQQTQQIMANNPRMSAPTNSTQVKQVITRGATNVSKETSKDLESSIKEMCAKHGRKANFRNGQWNCDPDNKVVYIPWNPTRLCYDPSGKVCQTGEPYQAIKKDSKTNTNSKTSSSQESTPHEASQKTKEMISKREAISYVWKTAQGKWLCQSPSSRLYLSVPTVEEAEKLCVCSGYRSKVPTVDGYGYMCNRPLESFDADVYEIYKLYSLAGVRKSYQCPKDGMSVECQ